jgi:Protein of unknown function (DUF3489)
MATFTIDSENNIAAHPAVPGNLENLQTFATYKDLAKLAAEWSGSRLVAIWNSFAGVAPFTDLKPVKKFTDRKAAVARIWAAIQRLSPEAAPPASNVAPAKETPKQALIKPAKRARAQNASKAAKGNGDERSSKKAEVIAMMKRAKGATLAEIMEATGWQAHTVRGFVSILGSQGGEKVESAKNANGERAYRITK